jgi:hypothetical protein
MNAQMLRSRCVYSGRCWTRQFERLWLVNNLSKIAVILSEEHWSKLHLVLDRTCRLTQMLSVKTWRDSCEWQSCRSEVYLHHLKAVLTNVNQSP